MKHTRQGELYELSELFEKVQEYDHEGKLRGAEAA